METGNGDTSIFLETMQDGEFLFFFSSKGERFGSEPEPEVFGAKLSLIPFCTMSET